MAKIILGKFCEGTCKQWRPITLYRRCGFVGTRKRRAVCRICEARLIRGLGPLP